MAPKDDDRQPSQQRLPRIVEEKNVAQHHDMAVVQPVARKATPIAMPAPPAPPPEDRQSYDDIEQVERIEQLERERAALLAQLQDAENENRVLDSENRTLREVAPTAFFPPPSLPPVEDKPPVELAPPAEPSDKVLLGARLRQIGTGAGVFAAMALSAFSSYRSQPEKAENAQARVTQIEQASAKDIEDRVLEKQRLLQALRADQCFFKQIRGAFQKQGIDLPSLPPGGVTLRRLDQGDPSKPPAFMADEKCPDLPQLPPDVAPQ